MVQYGHWIQTRLRTERYRYVIPDLGPQDSDEVKLRKDLKSNMLYLMGNL
jgi:hypothetical protein